MSIIQNSDCLAALQSVPVDSDTISNSRLNIDDKTRSNLFPWNGQFSPELIAVLLETYASQNDTVLDPFAGSGTVLAEAGRLTRPAIGGEINPAPFKLSSVYRLINECESLRRESIRSVQKILDDALPESFSLAADSHKRLSEPELKETLSDLQTPYAFARAMLDALTVLLDFNKPGLTIDRVFQCLSALAKTILQLPYSRAPIQTLNCDARKMPLGAQTADLVITSPPYINVFNYHQKYRASVEALGWDLLHVARSEIGSNRKHRGNRFLTIIQYCIDIAEVFTEMSRILKQGSRILFIVGRESAVRKTQFFNGDIAVQLATACVGLKAQCRQERVFTNRFGNRIYEDILHFETKDQESRGSKSPSDIAHDVLVSATNRAPKDSRADLIAAIESVDNIEASPIYSPQHPAVVS